jgi:hypothetical protein
VRDNSCREARLRAALRGRLIHVHRHVRRNQLECFQHQGGYKADFVRACLCRAERRESTLCGGWAQQSGLQHHRSIDEDWPPGQISRAPLPCALGNLFGGRQPGMRKANSFPHSGLKSDSGQFCWEKLDGLLIKVSTAALKTERSSATCPGGTALEIKSIAVPWAIVHNASDKRV